MAIRLKVAKSEREVDDALWVRHEVFVIEDGKFGGKPLLHERILDRYDAFPGVHNIVVYEDSHAVATLRVVMESAIGVPAFEYYDFSEYRSRARRELRATAQTVDVRFGSAGMLAVRLPWRARRDVIRAMFKVAAGVFQAEGATHVVAVVNADTAKMYRRLGFENLAEPFWVDEVGNFVTPLAASTESIMDWAFGDLPRTPLSEFRDSFERIFLQPGEALFSEGEPGGEAFIVDTGTVRIFRATPAGKELTLANLGRGELFGELALVDNTPRTASAVASTAVELMALSRTSFLAELYAEPRRVQELLQVFSQRIQKLNELALVLAFQPARQRMEFALNLFRGRAEPDSRRPDVLVYRGGVENLAQASAVDRDTAQHFLDERCRTGDIEVTSRSIRFFTVTQIAAESPVD